MSKLAIEYQGFLKFINKAKLQINSWFGPYCNHDPNKITFMASREWDVMSDHEKKYFIKSHVFDKQEDLEKIPRDKNPYFNYLLHKRHLNIPPINSVDVASNMINIQTDNSSDTFNPKFAKLHAKEWKSLSQSQRNQYHGFGMSELSMLHVIDRRDKLHKLYEPNELAILEFIIKTRPKRPANAHSWFLIQENGAIDKDETKEKWSNISKEDRRFYEVCAETDRKRFFFEKNLWLTRLVQIDLENPDFRLYGFYSDRSRSVIEDFNSIIGTNRNLIPGPRIKRPLGPFSLFLKDHRERTRKTKEQFVFGKHLKDSAAEWFKLTDKEKQRYKDASVKLKEAYLKKLESVGQKNDFMNQGLRFDLSNILFKKPDLMNEPYKLSQLIATKKRKAIQIFAKCNNLSNSKVQEEWNKMCPADKEPYIRESESLKTAHLNEKEDLRRKLQHIKNLVKKANELEKIKIKMHLLPPK